jgi:hypothetical protein
MTRVTEAMMSKETWTEPQASWVPLKTAVFKFGIFDDASASSEDQIPAMSLAELTNVLEERCGASSAAIDASTATLTILFSDGRTRSFIGTPWKLLETIPEVLIVPNSGHSHTVYLDEEGNLDGGYEENAKRKNKVRTAIDLIWRQLMLPAFNSAIAAERIALYARSHIDSPYFERLPAHVWPLLKVVDWDHGVAMAVDHTAFWSIHVELAAASNELVVPGANFHLQNYEIVKTEASHSVIREAIKDVYDKAQAAGNKPPNIKELPAAVLPLLNQKGHRASERLIMQLGEEPQFKRRRLPQGKRPHALAQPKG